MEESPTSHTSSTAFERSTSLKGDSETRQQNNWSDLNSRLLRPRTPSITGSSMTVKSSPTSTSSLVSSSSSQSLMTDGSIRSRPLRNLHKGAPPDDPNLAIGGGGSSVAHLVIHEGYLSGWIRKFSPNYGTGWQKRFFCLLEKDESVAYWRSVPEYVDEQPAGSINLVGIESVELDGGLGIILCSPSRDYQLLFDFPSEKDLWYNRILVVHHRARKTISGTTSYSMAHKLATWAHAQQQKSSTGFSIRSFLNRHSQMTESTEGMGPTTDQVDIKRRLLKYFQLFDPLRKAFYHRQQLASLDCEIPLGCPHAEISDSYTNLFRMNMYYLYHHRNPSLSMKDGDDDLVQRLGSGSTSSSTKYNRIESPYTECSRFDSPLSTFECQDDEIHLQIIVTDDNCRLVSSQEVKKGFGITTTSSPPSSPKLTLDRASSESTATPSTPLFSNSSREIASFCSSTITTSKHPSVCQCYASAQPMRRSNSLNSFHANALRHLRYPLAKTKKVTEVKSDSSQECYVNYSSRDKQNSHRRMLRESLDLNQVKTWMLELNDDQSRTIEVSELSNPRTNLLLHQSSSPLVPIPLGFLVFPTTPKIEFQAVGSDFGTDSRTKMLRPILSDDKAIPILEDSGVSTISIERVTTSEILRRSITACVDDLIVAERLCRDLDGISRFTDELAVGTADRRERQRLASCLYERSSPSHINPFVECLLTPTDGQLLSFESFELESQSTPHTTGTVCARCCLPLGTSPLSHYISRQLTSSRRATLLKILASPTPMNQDMEYFLDNVILGHLFLAVGSGRYNPYLAILISSSPIGSGKCFDIRRPITDIQSLSLPSGHSLNAIHFYSMDAIQWPLPETFPYRSSASTPEIIIHLSCCRRLTPVREGETGFEWSCQETRLVHRRFHEGTKKETRLFSFQARTEREANVFRQSMISSKLSCLSESKRCRIVRANYKGKRR